MEVSEFDPVYNIQPNNLGIFVGLAMTYMKSIIFVK